MRLARTRGTAMRAAAAGSRAGADRPIDGAERADRALDIGARVARDHDFPHPARTRGREP